MSGLRVGGGWAWRVAINDRASLARLSTNRCLHRLFVDSYQIIKRVMGERFPLYSKKGCSQLSQKGIWGRGHETTSCAAKPALVYEDMGSYPRRSIEGLWRTPISRRIIDATGGLGTVVTPHIQPNLFRLRLAGPEGGVKTAASSNPHNQTQVNSPANSALSLLFSSSFRIKTSDMSVSQFMDHRMSIIAVVREFQCLNLEDFGGIRGCATRLGSWDRRASWLGLRIVKKGARRPCTGK